VTEVTAVLPGSGDTISPARHAVATITSGGQSQFSGVSDTREPMTGGLFSNGVDIVRYNPSLGACPRLGLSTRTHYATEIAVKPSRWSRSPHPAAMSLAADDWQHSRDAQTPAGREETGRVWGRGAGAASRAGWRGWWW
jgi:hypothetical protein